MLNQIRGLHVIDWIDAFEDGLVHIVERSKIRSVDNGFFLCLGIHMLAPFIEIFSDILSSDMSLVYRNTPTLLFQLSQIFIHFAAHHLTFAQNYDFLGYSCRNNYNFTDNSRYQSNLNRTLSFIIFNVNSTIYGFNSSSVGQNPDMANALALCRGDVDSVTCGQCVYDSTIRARELCPNGKEAILWYERCMLSYSNLSYILTDVDESPILAMYNTQNVTDVARFNDGLRTLFNALRTRATSGGPLLKYASGNVSNPDFMNIFGIMQCTPNLSDRECDRCLIQANAVIPSCCNGRIGGRVLLPSCNIRFETYPFFQPTPGDPPILAEPPRPPPLSPALPPPPRGMNGNNTIRTILIIVLPIVVFVFFIVVVVWIFISRSKKRKANTLLQDVGDIISTVESLQYDLETIRIATNNFSESNKLGQGGFGAVFKGRLQNGLEIAVKRLSENSGQGEVEFKNEVVLLAKLQHRNLVRLLGFCLEGIERLLIYEFVPNASLDHFIFNPDNKEDLGWGRRYKIIGGIARGLLYLHEDSRLRIIHRDLKVSNVLLDEDMIPKIADFGMAKLFERDETQGNTSRIAGTYGYMAPEYAMHGKFSVKSDVYSFGVLVLEVISGQKNNGFRNGEKEEDLLSYAWNSWKEHKCVKLIDPILRSSHIHDIIRCIHIGLLCVQENEGDRPTMASVVLMLNSFSMTLPIPSEPAFFMHSSIFGPEKSYFGEYSTTAGSSTGKTNIPSGVSVNDSSITDIYPR